MKLIPRAKKEDVIGVAFTLFFVSALVRLTLAIWNVWEFPS